ncbi:prephenate dehydrogenase dimerization domain-containing protein [Rhodococcus sovatensis]|uniref:Prephenate dehydrogenase dimerization domain-containing protein n=1 Tax=Rhodococcus sovatensis TaxID=1805840 RepID=A0ABZ2PQP0_9NOCA
MTEQAPEPAPPQPPEAAPRQWHGNAHSSALNRATGPKAQNKKTPYDVIVIGGCGAVGSLLVGLLADDGLSVLTVDPSSESDTADRVSGDIRALDEDLAHTVKEAQVVVLAVPEFVALSTDLSLFGEDALVVETLSVKSGFAAVASTAPAGLQILGINPMFAPSLGMDGRPVAAVAHRAGARVDDFLHRIGTWGGRVVSVDVDQHDRVAAATQALTHAAVLAFGSALASLDVDPALVEAVAPPPARTALALLARISGGEPEVYWDVQAGNPYAESARHALATALADLDSAVTSGEESNFTRYLLHAGESVPDGDEYRALCARLFGIVREPAREEDRL